MELLKINRTKMIGAILQDYYAGVLEAAMDSPHSFNEYEKMASSDPAKLAALFTNDFRVILEQKPNYEICAMYSDIIS